MSNIETKINNDELKAIVKTDSSQTTWELPAAFKISVNIIEAKNLAWANSETVNSYVVVMLGKEKYRTSVRKNMEDPCYREFLVFEWNTTLTEVLRSNLWMAVMEPRCCAPPRLLGETNIDLGAIWAQPNHQVFHKWAQLCLPLNPAVGIVGFLKVDISITCKGDIHVKPVVITSEKLEKCFLPSVSEQQTANYVLTVYNAFGISTLQEQGDRRQEKLPSTYVKVSFCGISAKTAVQARSSNPSYNERISIVDMFPNICQSVHFEVCSAIPSLNQVLASIDLNLGQISHDGDNGFVPTFGPSLLHMYGNAISSSIEISDKEGPIYKGALLIALKTIVPYQQHDIEIANVVPIPAIQMDNLWAWEDFCIICPILEVSMLDYRLTGKSCAAAITIGEIPCGRSSNEDFLLMKKEIKKRKLHYTGPIAVAKSTNPYGHLDFTYAFPVLQQTTLLPDFRFRIFRNNLIQRIADHLEKTLGAVEKRLNNFEYSNPSELVDDITSAADYAAEHILKFLEIVSLTDQSTGSHDMTHYNTELDRKQLTLHKEELEKIYQQIKEKIKLSSSVNLMKLVGKPSGECYSVTKKNVKTLLVESVIITEKLKSLVFKSTEGWPDIVIWLLSEGSRFAFHKICTSDVVFSEIPEQSGKDCGHIQTLYMKPLKCLKHLNTAPSGCDCIAGKIELLLWMGSYSNLSYLNDILPQGHIIKCKEYDMCMKASILMVQCRVFIYRAKLTMDDIVAPPSPFVRINVLNSVRETQVQQKTLTPVWDQVLTVSCLVRTSQERIELSPPKILVEIYRHESVELIGRTEIQPAVDNTHNAEHAPKLKWYDLRKGLANTGQILMSALVRQMPETLVKSTLYSSCVTNGTITQDMPFEAENNIIEELPRSLKPKNLEYKIDIYWWGLRDVSVTNKPCAVLEIDDLAIKSDVIAEKKANCNFPNGRISQVFEGHLEKTFSPPLTVKLYDSTTFGRTIFLGTNAIKNPTKYLVEWLPKYERESSLRTVSFSSSMFYKVNKSLYIKKSTKFSESTTECTKITISSSLVDKKKWPTWKRLFCQNEPDEEEYVLLPVTEKKKEDHAIKIISEAEYQDWWARFFSSLKECGDKNVSCSGKIKIYNSELEQQPEYSKFKDWCTTLKLYNGRKTGMPEKDEELFCGFLKAGIAIYRWPPPLDTVAVSLRGVELQRGYFNDFPCNHPSKFLVRVYIVRGLNIVPTHFNGKCDPYVVVKSGAKEFGDRNKFVQNTVNPVFGRTYEMECSLPENYLLTVSMYDHQTGTHDALIGSTSIDLENRIFSKHRARVGLSSEYNVTGPSKWRDIEKPSDILAKLCIRNHIPPPSFPDGNTVVVNDVEYRDADMSNKTYISASERKENICLSLLHRWHTLPLCGYNLVPEHVETRHLFHPEKPNMDQGKVQMWVDIFPLQNSGHVPMPVDITPRKVEDYELRIIIWHVQIFVQDSLTAKKGVDLYVKAWIGHIEQVHYTDIHYNSINGEASFNWRMIFNFQYQHSDKKLIMMEKGPFTEFEERLPPILVVQVADSDAESTDDYLATLTLDLNAVPRGSRHCQRSTSDNPENTKKINLFSARSLRSWWPLKTVDHNNGTFKFAGMIDLELHLIPKQKAILMPVGLGRDAPFPLPEPNRPDTHSINMSSSVFENIFHREGAEYFAGAILLGIFIAAFYWRLPSVMLAYFYG